MNRRELVNAVAAETGVDSKQVDAIIKGFTDVVTTTVSGGETVAITGFAKFAKVERAARMGRNPATGETIRIKASKKARITPLKAFKDAVLAGKRAPAKKAAPAKAPARKVGTAKKTVVKKAAPARRAPAKKAPARKR